MVELKFHCAMPMFVARQWIRHRTASVNELSARYSLMPLLFYMPQQEQFALQSRSNKQGREGGAPPAVYRDAVERWEALRQAAGDAYAWMLEEDVAREIARIDLPVSTYTQWYWKIDLHNLLHFLSLRVDPRAQWEIQEFARAIAGMVKRVAPLSYEAWVDYDLESRPLTRAERDVLSRLVEASDDGVSARRGAAVSTQRDARGRPLAARDPGVGREAPRARPPGLRAGPLADALGRGRRRGDVPGRAERLRLGPYLQGSSPGTGSAPAGRNRHGSASSSVTRAPARTSAFALGAWKKL